ncbi:MAG: hypothetical protein BroJett015_08110 [Chloroflexota bacterium]|nr:MAG: hypothetical protein BroJett015_08110 [Chloroflexota bacterium]
MQKRLQSMAADPYVPVISLHPNMFALHLPIKGDRHGKETLAICVPILWPDNGRIHGALPAVWRI